MKALKLLFRYAPLALKWYAKHKGELKLPKLPFGIPGTAVVDDEAANWESLANHSQAQVRQRTSQISRLHTKAGFIILASVIMLQPVVTLRFQNTFMAYAAAISLILSLLFALATLYLNKTPAPLRPADLVAYLSEHPDVSKLQFQKRLAKNYAAAYAQLSEIKAKTETLLRYSTGLLLLSFVLTLASKLAS